MGYNLPYLVRVSFLLVLSMEADRFPEDKVLCPWTARGSWTIFEKADRALLLKGQHRTVESSGFMFRRSTFKPLLPTCCFGDTEMSPCFFEPPFFISKMATIIPSSVGLLTLFMWISYAFKALAGWIILQCHFLFLYEVQLCRIARDAF